MKKEHSDREKTKPLGILGQVLKMQAEKKAPAGPGLAAGAAAPSTKGFPVPDSVGGSVWGRSSTPRSAGPRQRKYFEERIREAVGDRRRGRQLVFFISTPRTKLAPLSSS